MQFALFITWKEGKNVWIPWDYLQPRKNGFQLNIFEQLEYKYELVNKIHDHDHFLFKVHINIA